MMTRAGWMAVVAVVVGWVAGMPVSAMTQDEAVAYLRNVQDRPFACSGEETITGMRDGDVAYDNAFYFRMTQASGNAIAAVTTSTVTLEGQPYTVVMQATGTAGVVDGQPVLTLTASSVTTGTPLPGGLEWHNDLGALRFTQTGMAPVVSGTLYDQVSGDAVRINCHLDGGRAFPPAETLIGVGSAEDAHRFIATTASRLITCEGVTYLKGDQGAAVGNVMTNIAYSRKSDGTFSGASSTVINFEGGPLIQRRHWQVREDVSEGRPRLVLDSPGEVSGDTFLYGIVEAPVEIELTFDDTSGDPNVGAMIDDGVTRYPATCRVKQE